MSALTLLSYYYLYFLDHYFSPFASLRGYLLCLCHYLNTQSSSISDILIILFLPGSRIPLGPRLSQCCEFSSTLFWILQHSLLVTLLLLTSLLLTSWSFSLRFLPSICLLDGNSAYISVNMTLPTDGLEPLVASHSTKSFYSVNI